MYVVRRIYTSDIIRDYTRLTIENGLLCEKSSIIGVRYSPINYPGVEILCDDFFVKNNEFPLWIGHINEIKNVESNPEKKKYGILPLKYSDGNLDDMEGYIIFLSENEKVQTSGDILWENLISYNNHTISSKCIILLKEGQFLYIKEHKIEVKDNMLLLN